MVQIGGLRTTSKGTEVTKRQCQRMCWLELLPLMGKKKFKPRPQNRILVHRRAPPSIFGSLALDRILLGHGRTGEEDLNILSLKM